VFLLLQVGEDPVDDGLLFNAGDDPHGTTTAGAGGDIDSEDAFEPLGPAYRDVWGGGVSVPERSPAAIVRLPRSAGVIRARH